MYIDSQRIKNQRLNAGAVFFFQMTKGADKYQLARSKRSGKT